MNGLNKQTKITLLIMLFVFGAILAWNIMRGWLIKTQLASNKPIPAVSVSKAKRSTWQSYLYAVGTMVAVNGVTVSTQAPGNVVLINFQSGQRVKKNDLLIQIDDRQEQAQLQNAQAALKLAQITFERNKTLVQQNAISKQAFDESCARYQQAQADVAQNQAAISYKHITAPFDGKLGIREVNLGQYLKVGDPIVSLQSMDPMYVNFFLPEQYLRQLMIGQKVTLQIDSIPKMSFDGKINALNSLVDTQTHNISVQATLANPNEKLFPGLFARVKVILPVKTNVVVIPATAINYTLYGDTVYVINREDKGKVTILLRDVTKGEQRNDEVIITSGLKAGEEVVTSGQLKLINGQTVLINNSVKP